MSRALGQRFVIHPTVASLANRIAELTSDTQPQVIQELRDSCRKKIATFPLEHHLRLAASDAATARAVWDKVATFADRGRLSKHPGVIEP